MNDRFGPNSADVNNFFDLNSLNSIRQQSNKTDSASKDQALEKAAKQFEAIFMQMLLKSMRSAQDVLESDSPFNSQTTKFYRDMHDQQLAVELSSNGSLGLSDLIVRQLGGGDKNYTPQSVLRTSGDSAGNLSELTNRRNPSILKNDVPVEQYSSVLNTNTQNRNGQSNSGNTQVTEPFKLIKELANQQVDDTKQQDFSSPQDFVSALEQPAKQVERQLGVPFQVVIAQAALETGWGQKVIKTANGDSSNNLFNIKADRRWHGEQTKTETLEFEQGTMVKKKEPFRVYDSIADSVNDYVNFLSSNERYQATLTATQRVGGYKEKVEHFLQGIQSAGYATDPKYAEKIIGTLKRVSQLLNQ